MSSLKTSMVGTLVAGALLVNANAHAQNASLRGRVIDGSTGAPVSQAIVRVPASNKYTLTTADGFFRIDGVARGFQGVIVINLGYAELNTRLNVHSDSVYTIARPPR